VIPALTTVEALWLLGALVVISAGVAAIVEGLKGALEAWPGCAGLPRRPILRGVSLVLGVVSVLALGDASALPWVVSVAAGALAGAASEVVYRWVLRDLLPLLADVVRRRLDGR